jgi:rhamnose transport system substrate-binding protein/rhamnose transport system permease protein
LPFRVRVSGQQQILVAAVAVEVVVFSLIAQNFMTAANFFEVMRVSVEIGLLALALTPIIITGGIDLSVGSMMGLAAVLFGAASRDWQLPVAAAAAVVLIAGLAGGALNATLIAAFGIPP